MRGTSLYVQCDCELNYSSVFDLVCYGKLTIKIQEEKRQLREIKN